MNEVPSHPPLPLQDSDLALERRSSTASHISATTPATSAVRVVAPRDYKPAALCLALAFASDHVIRYPIDTPDRSNWSESARFALHLRALEYITYAHCVKGLVTTIGTDYASVALWMPPGKNMDDWFTHLRSGLWRLNYQLSAQGRRRFFDEFLPLLARTKKEVMGERDGECWYLVYLGTKPEERRKGYARLLGEHVMKRADQEGRACYLESSNDVNVAIYEKMGFKVVRNIYLGGNGSGEESDGDEHEAIKMDIMVREPQPQSRSQQQGGAHSHL